MRTRPIGAGCDDDEIHRDMSGVEDERSDVVAHVTLGAPRAQQRRHGGVHLVDRAPRAEEGRYLLGRLAHAHLREHRPGGVLLRSGHGSAKTQRLDGPHVVIDADVPGPGQQRGHQAVGVVGLSPGPDVDACVTDRTRCRRGLLEQRSDEDGVAR